MKALLLALTCMTLVSCATEFIDTDSSDDGYGYKIEKATENGRIMNAVFKGNKHTPSDMAFRYSGLAAFKYCTDRKLETRIINTPKDNSTSYSYTGVGTINTGTSSYVYSYPASVRFPEYSVYFECYSTSRRFNGAVAFELVSKELVSPITMDFKGGLLVKSVSNPKLGMQSGDVLIKVGQVRIENAIEMHYAVTDQKPGAVKLTVIRAGKVTTVTGKIVDQTDLDKSVSQKLLKYFCKPGVDLEIPRICVPVLRKSSEETAAR